MLMGHFHFPILPAHSIFPRSLLQGGSTHTRYLIPPLIFLLSSTVFHILHRFSLLATTMLFDPVAFRDSIVLFVERYKDQEISFVAVDRVSGFVKGAVSGLQNQPIINVVIDGDDIIYRDYIDISIAVGTPKGLVVPMIRDAEKMNFAEIEKANSGSLSIDEMARNVHG
uniref:dihydrolipoyllysine-residue succinyltransferase n=1 Tax=Lactuca sativa TaxID=4236 RepID=A0A9R1W4S1_LACSA|nr:hypothetical protein LSAT_V11C300156050 [Lactuca sativa]